MRLPFMLLFISFIRLPVFGQADTEKKESYDEEFTYHRQGGDKRIVKLQTLPDKINFDKAERFLKNINSTSTMTTQDENTNSYAIYQLGIVGYAIAGSFYEVPEGYEQDTRFGWALGMYFMQGVPNFCWMPELLFAKRNFSSNQSFSGSGTTFKFKEDLIITRLLLNINFLYTPQLNSTFRLLIGVVPYFGYGLSAKRKQTETVISGGNTQTSSSEGNLGFGENGAQRAEFGFQLKAGTILNNSFLIHIGYAINARRIFTDTQEFRVNMFQLGLGYNLLKKGR